MTLNPPTILGVPTTYPNPIVDSHLAGSSRRGSGRLAAAMLCERRWELAVKDQLRPRIASEAQMCGSLFHIRSAFYHAAKMTNEKPPWFSGPSCEEVMREFGRDQPAEIERADKAFDDWREKVGDKDTMHPIMVEGEIGATVGDLLGMTQEQWSATGNPVLSELVTGRFDRICIQTAGPGAGKIYRFDTKTRRTAHKLGTWQEDNDYFLNWQVLLYTAIADWYFGQRNKAGGEVADFVIERIKQRPPYETDRNPVLIPSALRRRMGLVIYEAVARELHLHQMLAAGYTTLQNGIVTGACGRAEVRNGIASAQWACDFRQICGADTIDIGETLKASWYSREA